jgi:hypothetical protein
MEETKDSFRIRVIQIPEIIEIRIDSARKVQSGRMAIKEAQTKSWRENFLKQLK